MEAEGYLHRVYGGAVLAQPANSVTPLVLRDGEHAAQKEEIAKRAAEMVTDGSTLLMDASSTTRRMFKHLEHRHGLRIFTNNVRAVELMAKYDNRSHLVCGRFFCRFGVKSALVEENRA